MYFKKRHDGKRCNTDEQQSEVEISSTIMVDEMVEDYLLRTRRIWIAGEVTESMAIHVCSYLQMFSLTNKPIYLYIHSPGGCVSSGYAIIDQMQACKCDIYTVVKGHAHSMGAIIAAFGKKGCRYAAPNSSMMLHSMMMYSQPDTIDRHSVMVDFVQDDYVRKVKMLARRTKLTSKRLLLLMNETKWMSPKQAIKIGLIDGIWTPQLERSLNESK